MGYRFPYQTYEDLPKQERRDIASREPMLSEKRFLLSSSPEAKERLASLRRHVNDLMEIYPELVGVGVFGSLLKGYASADSDIDAYVFTDARRLSHTQRADRRLASISPPGKQIGSELEVLLELDGYGSSLGNIRLDETHIHGEPGGRVDLFEEAMLFLPSIGKGLLRYRQETIRYMLVKGERGSTMWRAMMGELWRYENAYLPEELQEARKSLYLFSLSDAARHYFVTAK